MIAAVLLAAAATWSAPQTAVEGRAVARPQAFFTGAGQPVVVSAPGTVLPYAKQSEAAFELVSHGLTTQLRVRFNGGKAKDLAPGRDVLRYSAATDAKGNMVVAYIRNVRDGAVIRKRFVEVVNRPAGGSFGTPQTIAGKDSPTSVGAGIGRGGERFVAYERGGRLEVRRREAGHSWNSPQKLGAAAQGHTQIDVAAGPDGTAAVAWFAQALSEGGDNGAASFRVALRDARGHNFHTARLLESFSARAPQETRIDVAVASDGGGVVGWTGRDGGHFAARAVDLHGGEPQALSPSSAVLGAVDAAAGGAAIAVWAPPLDTPSPQVFAAVRATGAATFGAPETVSPAYREVVGPVVALDPASGRALAAWLARTGQSTQAALSSLRSGS